MEQHVLKTLPLGCVAPCSLHTGFVRWGLAHWYCSPGVPTAMPSSGVALEAGQRDCTSSLADLITNTAIR